MAIYDAYLQLRVRKLFPPDHKVYDVDGDRILALQSPITLSFNLLAPELFFLILANPVYKT